MWRHFTWLAFLSQPLTNAWIDSNIDQIDTVACNNIFPFTFGKSNSALEIVDWDIQNFNDNYSQY